MAWAKIDDGWWCHPKTMNLTVSAAGLWALALSWSCHQRRDVVPRRFLAMVDAHEEHAKELVDVGLWHETPDGWQIHNWSDYQERTLSEKRADAGRKGGKASGEARREANDEAPPKQEPSKPKQPDEADEQAGALPVPARPDPPQEPSPPDKPPADEIFETLVDVCGWDLKALTKSARGRANKATKELREIGASPDGIRARADVHRRRWPDMSLTPNSIAANYAELGKVNGQARASPADVCPDCGQATGRHDDETCEAVKALG